MRLLRSPATRRLLAAASGLVLVVSLAGCSDDGSADPGVTPSPSAAPTSVDPDVFTTGVPDTTPPDDAFPTITFDQPLAPDVTDDELQQLLDAGLLPIAPAHDGAYETMINAFTAAPKPDVVLFGDSMVQQGVEPQTLGALLSKETGREVKVFNGASSRSRRGMNRLFARYLVSIDKAPKVALIGLTPRGGEHDSLYNGEGAHSPFSSVVEGCDRPASNTWDDADAAACQEDVDDLRTRFRRGGTQVARALKGEEPQTSLRIDPSRLRSDGFLSQPGITTARVTKIAEARLERGFPGFPTVHDDGQEQFDETVQILRDAGTTVIGFELPYSPAYQASLEKAGRNYDARRQAAARQLAAGADVPVFEVKDFKAWWSDGDSRDAIHLSTAGARKFAVQLTTLPGFTDAVVEALG